MKNHLEQRFNNIAYRSDIDGLRAIAVIAVISYHFFPSWFKGGFVGVDIFFVISGYLISTIIFANSKKYFSLSEFYLRRIRRIFPALLIIMIVTIMMGWSLLLADEYKQLGKHVAGGASFISNFILLNESGYFDNASNTKPLLHLWSLGIEEQFYIFWPLLICLMLRKNFPIFLGILTILTISFILNINGVQKDGVATFYWPHTRIWELIVGSLLAWFSFHRMHFLRALTCNKIFLSSYCKTLKKNNQNFSTIVATFGISLIGYSIFAIEDVSKFPGWYALIPVSGTVMMIISGPNNRINKIFLGNKFIVWIGLISYPLYLWHWPLYVFTRIYQGEIPSLEVRILIIFTAVLLSWLTYKFIEYPVRFLMKSNLVPMMLICIMFCVGTAGYYIFINDGIPTRLRHQSVLSYVNTLQFSPTKKECFDVINAYKKEDNWFCKLGPSPSKVDLFAMGDSHAASLLPALETLALKNSLNILFAGTSGCPPLLGIQSERGYANIEKYNCQLLNERIFDYVKQNKVNAVLLIARWIYYTGNNIFPHSINYISNASLSEMDSLEGSRVTFRHGLRETIERYNAIGVKVFILLDNPQQRISIADALRTMKISSDIESDLMKSSITLKEHQLTQIYVNGLIAELSRGNNVQIINFDDTLCKDGICPLAKEKQSIYYDTHHLTVYGAKLITPVLENYLKPISSK